MRLRHFRDGEELRWIIYDDFFDYDYEQYRFLNHPVRVLPGDHLVLECHYSSGEEVVLTEMCAAPFLAYTESNKRPKYLASISWVDLDHQLRVLGIKNYTAGTHQGHLEVKITEPRTLVGELKEVLSHRIHWNSKLVKKFQELYLFGAHYSSCSEISLQETSPHWSSLEKNFVSTPAGAILNPFVRTSVCPSQGITKKDQWIPKIF